MSRPQEIAPQLVSPFDLGRPALLLTSSKELERGVRAALFLVPQMFRFDTIVEGDTLRTVVRNLSASTLEISGGHHIVPGSNLVRSDAAALDPARATIEFTLVSDAESVHVDITIGSLLLADLGLMRISAQALLRHLPSSAGAVDA